MSGGTDTASLMREWAKAIEDGCLDWDQRFYVLSPLDPFKKPYSRVQWWFDQGNEEAPHIPREPVSVRVLGLCFMAALAESGDL